MRVAYFSEVYCPNMSGIAQTLERTVTELLRRGHGARVYAPAPNEPLDGTDRPEVHRSPAGPLLLDPAFAWARPRMAEILPDLRAFRPDLVHVATEFPMGRAGLRAAKALGVPVIASAHTEYERYALAYRLQWALPAGWAYLRSFYSRAEVVLAPTRSFETHLRQRGVMHTGRWEPGMHDDLLLTYAAYRHRAERAA